MYTKQEYKLYDDAYKEIIESTNIPVFEKMLVGHIYTLKTDNYNIKTIANSNFLGGYWYTVTIKANQSAQTVSFIGRYGGYAYKMYIKLFDKVLLSKRQR